MCLKDQRDPSKLPQLQSNIAAFPKGICAAQPVCKANSKAKISLRSSFRLDREYHHDPVLGEALLHEAKLLVQALCLRVCGEHNCRKHPVSATSIRLGSNITLCSCNESRCDAPTTSLGKRVNSIDVPPHQPLQVVVLRSDQSQ